MKTKTRHVQFNFAQAGMIYLELHKLWGRTYFELHNNSLCNRYPSPTVQLIFKGEFKEPMVEGPEGSALHNT